ncbi:MAG: hypothetical protein PUK40_02105, partial [Actinomycetaceae bacterium]|nr:hypothetical protein [Actinomycetaceae bacterium]
FRALTNSLMLDRGWRGEDWKISRGKGYERAVYLPRSASIEPFAPTKDSLHGDHLNFVTLDETWAFDFDEGMELETAIKPTFLTMKVTQLLRLSTKGTANSSYLNYNIERGREATKDPASRRFYFEWSADERLAEDDPYSDATLAFHPAIGYTQTARKIRELGHDMPIGEWRRSFLNLETQTKETLIDLALWDSLRWDYDPDAPACFERPAPHETVLAWDCGIDGKTATIYAAWLHAGEPVCQQVATQPGTAWLTGALRQLYQRGYRAIVTDDTGVNRTILQELSTENIPITVLTYGEYATACQTFFDRVKNSGLVHDGATSVTQAITVAAAKNTPRATILNARNSAGNIDPLRALAIAQDAAARMLSVTDFQLF